MIAFFQNGSLEEQKNPLPFAKLGEDGMVHQINPETQQTLVVWTNAKITGFESCDKTLI